LYSRSTIARKYLRYLISASNGKGHGIHSPFVFDFVVKVLNDRTSVPVFREIEALRADLLRDESMLVVRDFGAGSVFGSETSRKMKDIARNAAKPAKYGRLLFRIAEYYGARRILELGTSLGLSTLYLASASKVQRVITLEGSEAIARKAAEHFTYLGKSNIRQITGNFDDCLQDALQLLGGADLVFFDGNHREEPTLRYFNQCLPHAGEETIFVLDDIHWSKEMESAWNQIKAHERVTCTIDLFFVGVVVFRTAFKEKQHFTIRF
jgi:predicted O-methyltransferase YrrM